jgi:hypothetical protein
MGSCYECGGYVDGYGTCPDCVRIEKAERRAREREEDDRRQRESEFRQQQRQREWELEEQNRQYEVNRLLSAAAIHGESWGYSIDTDVADYDFMLSEDGQLSWNCRPKGVFAQDLVASKLIKNGFLRRMRETIGKNPPPGVVKHISQLAYNAGATGLISDFHIPYEHKGFRFRLDLSPRVQFDLDENNSLVWKRVNIFQNKEIMLQYDKGLSQYANSQAELLTSRIIEARKQEEAQKDIERKEARKHDLLGNTLVFYMFFSCFLLPWYLTEAFFHPYYWGTSVVLTAFFFRSAANKESPKTSVFIRYTLWNIVTYLWFS